MGTKIKQYDATFKQDAVNYYYSSGKSMKEAANDLKIATSTLSKWASSANTNDDIINHRGSGNYSSDAEKEIVRLRKELKDHKEQIKSAISNGQCLEISY